MRTLAAVNQKGGVGKTTNVVQLSFRAREHGKRTLLVDFDPQKNLNAAFPRTGAHTGNASTSFDLFSEGATIIPEVLDAEDGFAIIRGDDRLRTLSNMSEEEIKRPARYLRSLAKDFDICIIDSPGVLGYNPPMTIAALVCSDATISPFGLGLFEGDPLVELMQFLKQVKQKGYNPALKIIGLLPSRIHTTSRKEMSELQKIRDQLGAAVLPIILGERRPVKEATDSRKAVWKASKGSLKSKAGQEWLEATDYVLNKLGVIK